MRSYTMDGSVSVTDLAPENNGMSAFRHIRIV
jgi:hypothetical protein